MLDPCRYDEAASLHTENAPAPSFAAVRRDQCRVVVTRSTDNPGSPLVWRSSSKVARRGWCRECSTSLVMDYEWLEPNTVWLVRPSWVKVCTCFKKERKFHETFCTINLPLKVL